MKILLCCAAVLLVAVSNRAAVAQHSDDHDRDGGVDRHTDDTAKAVERAANAVAWEMSRHHRSHRNFRQVYREIKEIWAVARHVHDLLHNNISNARLRRNVAELDELFHHVEEHVEDWDLGYSRRSEGGWHDEDYGAEHLLMQKMARLERGLHHLMQDTGVDRRRESEYEASEIQEEDRLPE